MALNQPVRSDHELARLLQIGIVLEEVVEARASKHAQHSDAAADPDLGAMLHEAAAESAEHRDRLESLLEDLDAETVAFEQIQKLVEAQYEAGTDTDGVLYDQLCNEETAYKFYDDLVGAIRASEATFGVDRERLLETLTTIREEEADGVETVTKLMEEGDDA